MKAKALVLVGALSASMLVAAPAQAHYYYDDYPYGLLSGLYLGLTWNHYYDHDRHYRHREYRRSESYGRYRHDRHDRHGHHHDDDRHNHHHRDR